MTEFSGELLRAFALLNVSGVLLLSLRVGAVLAMTPILYKIPIPNFARAILVLGLSIVVSAGLQADQSLAVLDTGQLFAAAMSELAFGATLGLGILLAFAAIDLAGRLMDLQIGFGIAQIFDPLSRTQSTLVTSTLNLVALLVFFLVDGHHALLRGISYSIERFPVAQAPSIATESPLILLAQLNGVFTLGFALAAPIVFCILMVEFALGVVSRNLPQMNMFAFGIPVKTVIGILALSLWSSGMGVIMTRIYGGIYSTWDQIFAAPKNRNPSDANRLNGYPNLRTPGR